MPEQHTPTIDELPLVTCIVPNYNYSQWIEECIDSLANQDYPNKQIIVVDDCSTDKSIEKILAIIKEPKQSWVEFPDQSWKGNVIYGKYKNVTLGLAQTEVNSGPSKCRNIGIRLAGNSVFYYFLDSDDTVALNKLSKCVAKMLEYPGEIGLIYTDNYNYNVETKTTTREYREPFDFQRLHTHNMVRSDFFLANIALQKMGLYFEGLRLGEDLDLSLRLGETNFMIYHIPECLMTAKVHPQNTTTSQQQEKWQQAWYIIGERLKHRRNPG